MSWSKFFILGADRSTPVKTVFAIMIEIVSDYCDIKTPYIKSIKQFTYLIVQRQKYRFQTKTPRDKEVTISHA